MALVIVIFSYKYIKERKLLKFLICVFIASLFHKTSIVFLPAYFLYKLKFNYVLGFLYTAILVVTIFFKETIFVFLSNFIGKEVVAEQTGAYTLLIIVTIIIIASLLFYKKSKQQNDKELILFNFNMVTFYLIQFVTVSQIAIRVVYYYYIYMIIFIPYILSKLSNKNTKLILILAMSAFLITYFLLKGVYRLNCMPYAFFWEG